MTDNNFAHFIGVSMTIAYAFSLMSRSYAIYRGINLQLFGAFAPLAAAMIIAGGCYPLGIAVGIAPLVLYMKGYSTRLRANFLAVVTAQQEAATLAARLDMALNNMSHGLCMLDPDGRLVLTNDQALKMFNLLPEDAPDGRARQIGFGEDWSQAASSPSRNSRVSPRSWPATRATASISSFRSKRSTTAPSRSPFIA